MALTAVAPVSEVRTVERPLLGKTEHYSTRVCDRADEAVLKEDLLSPPSPQRVLAIICRRRLLAIICRRRLLLLPLRRRS